MTSVLLTGATGFVGGATAHALLRSPYVTRLVLLARGDSAADARARVEHSLQRFGRPGAELRKVLVVHGDLLSVQLGSELIHDVTHVIHAAACTSFRSTRRVQQVNVDGTLALARQLSQGGRLTRFLHVSTAYRCGVVPNRVVDEDTPASPHHVVEYSRTKAQAEELLQQLDLPLVVARPSVVIGHTELGVAPSTSLFWYYLALARAGVAPFTESRFRDIVPVDYVAEALTHLLFLPRHEHREVHISAGEGSSRTWREIRQVLGQSCVTRTMSPAALGEHPAFTHPRLAGAVALCARFATVPVDWFSNQRLLDSGVPPPPAFTDYAQRCVETARGLMEMLDDDA